MDKSKRDLIITVALLCVLFFFVGKNFLFKKQSSSRAASAEGSHALTPESISILGHIKQNQTLWDAQRSQWEENEWGRDPFYAEGSEAGKFAALPFNVTGIVWDEKMPFAIINDKVLKKGDQIEGYTVVEIKPGSVVFSSGEETVELQLFRASSEPHRA